jgi:uncharacterized membrane protein YkoI
VTLVEELNLERDGWLVFNRAAIVACMFIRKRGLTMYNKKLTAALAIAVLGSTSTIALADKPGADWITLEQAVEKAKAAGYTSLHSIGADDSSWEGEGVKADGKVWEFKLDGRTGEVTREKED